MKPTTEEEAVIALRLMRGVGDKVGRKLVEHFGSALAVFSAPKADFLSIPLATEKLYVLLQNPGPETERAKREIAFAKREGVKVLSWIHPDYPRRLKHCPDAPLCLFTKGELNLNVPYVLGIVGTRNATQRGKELVHEIVKGLAGLNVLIVSGLAHGIDGQAHQAALNENLHTACVLAHGLDRIYPAEHRGMAAQMLDRGGWVSDYLSETNPDIGNFPERNRIVAGLSDAVLVVESKRKGGSMITADLAFGYNRDVFAIPGRPGDVLSEGCNHLIKTDRARLIEGAHDICYHMGWELKKEKAGMGIPKQPVLLFDLSPEEQKILELLESQGKIGLDELAGKLEMPVSALSIPLLNLELNAVIRALPGKVYEIH